MEQEKVDSDTCISSEVSSRAQRKVQLEAGETDSESILKKRESKSQKKNRKQLLKKDRTIHKLSKELASQMKEGKKTGDKLKQANDEIGKLRYEMAAYKKRAQEEIELLQVELEEVFLKSEEMEQILKMYYSRFERARQIMGKADKYLT